MKYLFYDAESIDIEHKCSFTFGYLVTDDKFNIIIPKEDIVFNPDIQKKDWDWRAIRTIINDSYFEKNILKNKTFPHYYNKIKNLFKEDVLCIGFETNEDVKYLLGNCNKYDLEPINFKYIDLRDIIKYLTGEKSKSLIFEYIKYFHKFNNEVHKSSTDAEMTMLILKEILKLNKRTLDDILKENENFVGVSKDFIYGFNDNKIDIKNPKESTRPKLGKYKAKKIKEGQEDWIKKGSINNLLFIRFLDFVKPIEEVKQIFKDKKISISLNYEMYHFQDMLKIVQLITNYGGEYVKKGSLADIFVKQDEVVYDKNGNIIPCSKYKYVLESIQEGKNIEILEFDEFLSKLHITKEQLEVMQKIDTEYLNDEKYSSKN